MNWFKEQAEKAKKASDKIKKKATQKKPKAFSGPGYSLGDTGSINTSAEAKVSSQTRRDQQLRAAQERGNAWDKKVAQGRVNRQPVAPPLPPVPPARVEVDGPIGSSGFNPYASTICSSSQARAASTYRDVESDSFDRGESYSDLDGVHTLLEQDPEQAKVAIQTLQKMLSNISAHPDEAKYRKIRQGNSAFRTKVEAVKGGLRVLEDVGFVQDKEHWILNTGESPIDIELQKNTLKQTLDQLEVAMTHLALHEE